MLTGALEIIGLPVAPSVKPSLESLTEELGVRRGDHLLESAESTGIRVAPRDWQAERLDFRIGIAT